MANRLRQLWGKGYKGRDVSISGNNQAITTTLRTEGREFILDIPDTNSLRRPHVLKNPNLSFHCSACFLLSLFLAISCQRNPLARLDCWTPNIRAHHGISQNDILHFFIHILVQVIIRHASGKHKASGDRALPLAKQQSEAKREIKKRATSILTLSAVLLEGLFDQALIFWCPKILWPITMNASPQNGPTRSASKRTRPSDNDGSEPTTLVVNHSDGNDSRHEPPLPAFLRQSTAGKFSPTS